MAAAVPKGCTCQGGGGGIEITIVIEESLEVGTRIHWDPEQQCLFLVDVPSSKFLKFDPESKALCCVKVGEEPLGFMFPVKGTTDKFVAGVGRKFAIVTWNQGGGACGCKDEKQGDKGKAGGGEGEVEIEVIGEVDGEPGRAENRLNGAKIDETGRLWAGTMGPDGQEEDKLGSLFSLSQKTLRKHMCNIGVSNGIAWSLCGCYMYYIDTVFPGIYRFKYDEKEGDIANREVIFEFSKFDIPGQPDGMLIDAEGKLWVACIHGGRIIRVDPQKGELMQTVEMPTCQITSICFGGKELDVMYATSAKMEKDGKKPDAPPAGCTFQITGLGVKGIPHESFNLEEK